MKNYYKTLGVSRDASREEIKKAYIQLAVRYHPDKNPGDDLSEQFKEVNEAKQVLLNDLKKFNYDISLVDFLAKNSSSKSKGVTRKRSKGIYDLLKIRLRKNRLFVAILFSIIILVSAAFFQIPPDEPTVDAAETSQSILPPGKKSLEARAVVLSFFETNAKAVKKTPVANKTAEPKRIVVASASPKKKRLFKVSRIRLTTPRIRRVLAVKLGNGEMVKILNNIRAEKQKVGSNSNCIQILKTNKSNITNAFALADFLKSYGFVISGREKIVSSSNGIKIIARGNCIKVMLGRL